MRVLVIDDSPFMLGIVKVALGAGGYEVDEVDPACLFDVLQALHAHKPDLVITDLEMPQCHGESVVRAIREDQALKDLKVMVLTAHNSEALVDRLGRWDILGYLMKPLTPQTLLERVQELLPPA